MRTPAHFGGAPKPKPNKKGGWTTIPRSSLFGVVQFLKVGNKLRTLQGQSDYPS